MKNEFGTPFQSTATGSTSVSASEDAIAGKRHFITDISVSSDKPGSVCQIKSGSTIIWQNIVNGATGTTIFPYSEHFITPLPCDTGATASVNVDGTAACSANVSGFTG